MPTSIDLLPFQGRMAMVDVLAHAKEKALNEVNPHLMTIATLTGHVVLAYGGYSAVMDNGTAKKESFAHSLQATGDVYGDMFEVLLFACAFFCLKTAYHFPHI